MKYNLEVFQIQEFGMRRDAAGNPHQEDSMFPAFGYASPADRLFILCDGMGGHEKGEVASTTVCETMGRTILQDEPSPDASFSELEFHKALDAAYDALDARDSGGEKKMGTTLTFLKLASEGAFIAHIGDSRVYHIRPGKDADSTRILHMTQDHSLVNDLIRVGELTEQEAKDFPRRNVITRAMQPGMSPRPHADIFTTSDIRPGDYFYLCSDGMLENMEDSNIRFNFSDMAGDAATKVEILRKATASNSDNHTAFIVHILDVIPDMTVQQAGNRQEPARNEKKTGRIREFAEMLGKANRKVWLYGLGALAAIAIAGILFFTLSDKDEEEYDEEDFPIERANYDASVIEPVNPSDIPPETRPTRRYSTSGVDNANEQPENTPEPKPAESSPEASESPTASPAPAATTTSSPTAEPSGE